mgnify:FL=1
MSSRSPRGLQNRFVVRRRDARDEPGGDRAAAKYFVLDAVHDRYAAVALRAYADACRWALPELAADLDALAELGPEARS